MKKLIYILIGFGLILSPTIASAATITHSLSVGARGAEVMLLQETLIKLGFLKVSATGYFGNLTKLAIIAFQKDKGLEPVGIVGPKTRAQLNALLEVSMTPPATTPTSMPPPPASPGGEQTTGSTTSSAPPPPPPAASPDSLPIVTLVSPMSVVARTTTEVNFAVMTDKVATCRYGTQPGMSLTYMTSFEDSGMMHSRLLTGLSSSGLYIYYVRCEDTAGRVSNELTVTFSLTGQ